jgi:uncharacterized membrane protein
MKILKYFFVFLLFGLVGILVATFFAPKQHEVDSSVVINKPVGECWDACFNPDKMPLWWGDLDSVNHIYGEYDRKKYNAKLIFGTEATRTKADYKLDSVVKHTYAHSKIVLDEKLELGIDYHFVERDSSSCELKLHTTLSPSGYLMRLMVSNSSDALAEKRQGELNALKAYLEEE